MADIKGDGPALLSDEWILELSELLLTSIDQRLVELRRDPRSEVSGTGQRVELNQLLRARSLVARKRSPE